MLASCCPAFVDYVEKKLSRAGRPHLPPPSPMVMAARHLKKVDPAQGGLYRPCVAKKKEIPPGQDHGGMDCASPLRSSIPSLSPGAVY